MALCSIMVHYQLFGRAETLLGYCSKVLSIIGLAELGDTLCSRCMADKYICTR
jgi:hypothetical protein